MKKKYLILGSITLVFLVIMTASATVGGQFPDDGLIEDPIDPRPPSGSGLRPHLHLIIPSYSPDPFGGLISER
jgi:hypothetical protein